MNSQLVRSVRHVLAAFSFGVVALSGTAEPFSFNYDGREYRGFEGTIDGTLKVSVERRDFTNYPGASWYTVWFENVGTKPSAVLKDVVSIDETFTGADPVLRGIYGDAGERYRAYEHEFAGRGPKSFQTLTGYATHNVFPYFNLVHGDGGTLLALGWAGYWRGDFTPGKDGVRFVGRNSVGFDAQLLPGEKVRSALVLRLPYAGRSDADAMNLWRRWYLEYVLPRNADGSRLKPIRSCIFAYDTGLPNSDGSISERSTTWKRTADKLVAERIVPDVRWFDAGWYRDPEGRSVSKDWWGTVGTWEIDREKWPGTSFRESNEYCHRLGMKVLVWFEPERVTMLDALCRNCGYRREWAASPANKAKVVYSYLGNPDCLRWTLGRIVKMMDENAVDMYREDSISVPSGAWAVLDERTEKATGLRRRGISENRGIQGHYALWDGIIAHCRSKGKCPYVDSCSGGGGRNDLESMRRGFPMMRSDADRTTTGIRLSMSWGFNKWIPYHGSSVKETKGQVERPKQVPDDYVNRASLLPVYNSHMPFSQGASLDFDRYRRNVAEWEGVRDLLLKDYYTLTPWHGRKDLTGWTVFAYHDPETDDALILGFRQEECAEDTCTVTLPFVKDPAKRTLTIRLDAPRSSYFRRFRPNAAQSDAEDRTGGHVITLPCGQSAGEQTRR